MSALDLLSEAFNATGNVTSEGVINQLGRPSLDPLSLLVRETVQNSWDARILTWGGVRFEVDAWTPSATQLDVLRNVIFAKLPDRLPLRAVLAEEALPDDPPDSDATLRLLAISDRGTIGLGGPTRADVASDPGQPRDFVDFLRNVGLPPDRPMTGGTFGYGKAALYLTSRARTICVYTRWKSPDGFQSRFQAAGLGSAHTTPSENGVAAALLTGRHWWGRLVDGVAEPVLDDEADGIAGGLGLDVMTGSETGTSIVVVGPYLDGLGLDEAIEVIVAACLWNFWPKMLPDADGNIPVSFGASSEGRPHPIPPPGDYPPLHGFVEALRRLDAGAPDDDEMGFVRRIASQRPRRLLGLLSLCKVPARPRLGTGARQPPAPFEGVAHHVALMRQLRLVVKYVEGPRLPIDAVEYAGVFVADGSVDEIFKSAEPPTHDDWIDSFVELRNDRTAIHVADREIRAALDGFALPGVDESGVGGGAVAALARELAGLLPGLDGPGSEVEQYDPPGPSRARVRRARVRIVDQAGPALDGTVPVITVRFDVTHSPETAGTTVEARAAVALDGGELETDAPIGAPAPQVLGWRSPSGQRSDGERVFIAADDAGVWEVRVAGVPNAMIGIDLHPVVT
jgi:hypothetical protein